MAVDTRARAIDLMQQAINLLQETNAPQKKTDDPETDLIRLTGTVGRPEYREAKGLPLYTFGLGIRRIDAKTEWINGVAWRKTALWAQENVRRGDTVAVQGYWETQEWTDQSSGELKAKNVFIVNHFESVNPES